MLSTPEVSWSLASPLGRYTRPPATIGLFQWPEGAGRLRTRLPFEAR